MIPHISCENNLIICGCWLDDNNDDKHNENGFRNSGRFLKPYLFRSWQYERPNQGSHGTAPEYPFVARFDVALSYDTIPHEILIR